MTATSEISEEYAKVFNCDHYKNNIEGAEAGLEALCKTITGYDYNVQMQAWQKILNDPESDINKSMRMWSEYSKQIDYEKLEGLQAGVQRFAEQITKFDASTLSSLKAEQLFDTDSEIGKSFTEVYDCAYEAAKEIEEPDIGNEELKNSIIEEINNKDVNKHIIKNSRSKKFLFYIIAIIIFNMYTYLNQIGLIENTLVTGFINHIISNFVNPLVVNSAYDDFKITNIGVKKIGEQ